MAGGLSHRRYVAPGGGDGGHGDGCVGGGTDCGVGGGDGPPGGADGDLRPDRAANDHHFQRGGDGAGGAHRHRRRLQPGAEPAGVRDGGRAGCLHQLPLADRPPGERDCLRAGRLPLCRLYPRWDRAESFDRAARVALFAAVLAAGRWLKAVDNIHMPLHSLQAIIIVMIMQKGKRCVSPPRKFS